MTIRFRVFLDIDKMAKIRLLTSEDIPSVAKIEKLCFSEPWSKESLGLLLQEKNAGFVAEVDGVAVAYGGIVTVLDEGQITNIATHPDHRRCGLAKAIMAAIDDFSAENRIVYLSLEVREQNMAARSLYASCGWQEVGVRKNFYSKPLDNAIVMIKDFTKGN